jgi:hypothetical protein
MLIYFYEMDRYIVDYVKIEFIMHIFQWFIVIIADWLLDMKNAFYILIKFVQHVTINWMYLFDFISKYKITLRDGVEPSTL